MSMLRIRLISLLDHDGRYKVSTGSYLSTYLKRLKNSRQISSFSYEENGEIPYTEYLNRIQNDNILIQKDLDPNNRVSVKIFIKYIRPGVYVLRRVTAVLWVQQQPYQPPGPPPPSYRQQPQPRPAPQPRSYQPPYQPRPAQQPGGAARARFGAERAQAWRSYRPLASQSYQERLDAADKALKYKIKLAEMEYLERRPNAPYNAELEGEFSPDEDYLSPDEDGTNTKKKRQSHFDKVKDDRRWSSMDREYTSMKDDSTKIRKRYTFKYGDRDEDVISANAVSKVLTKLGRTEEDGKDFFRPVEDSEVTSYTKTVAVKAKVEAAKAENKAAKAKNKAAKAARATEKKAAKEAAKVERAEKKAAKAEKAQKKAAEVTRRKEDAAKAKKAKADAKQKENVLKTIYDKEELNDEEKNNIITDKMANILLKSHFYDVKDLHIPGKISPVLTAEEWWVQKENRPHGVNALDFIRDRKKEWNEKTDQETHTREFEQWKDDKEKTYKEEMKKLLDFPKHKRCKFTKRIQTITFVHVIYVMVSGQNKDDSKGLKRAQYQVDRIKKIAETCQKTTHLVAFVEGTMKGTKFEINKDELYNLLGYMCYFAATLPKKGKMSKPAGIGLFEYLITDDKSKWKVSNDFLGSFFGGHVDTKRKMCMVCNLLKPEDRLLVTHKTTDKASLRLSTMLKKTGWKNILTSEHMWLFMKGRRKPFHGNAIGELDKKVLNDFVNGLKNKNVLERSTRRLKATSGSGSGSGSDSDDSDDDGVLTSEPKTGRRTPSKPMTSTRDNPLFSSDSDSDSEDGEQEHSSGSSGSGSGSGSGSKEERDSVERESSSLSGSSSSSDSKDTMIRSFQSKLLDEFPKNYVFSLISKKNKKMFLDAAKFVFKDESNVERFLPRKKEWWDLHSNNALSESTAIQWQEWEWVWRILPEKELKSVHNLSIELHKIDPFPKWLPFVFSNSPPTSPLATWIAEKPALAVPENVLPLLEKYKQTIKNVSQRLEVPLKDDTVATTMKSLIEQRVMTTTFNKKNWNILKEQFKVAKSLLQ